MEWRARLGFGRERAKIEVEVAMYQTIVDSMQALEKAVLTFTSEREFQAALSGKLQQMSESDGWRWRTEDRFRTKALTNEENIDIDVVGRHCTKGMVAIELKLVKVAANGRPSDPPAFPWDVAKDCLKLELLRGGHCEPALPEHSDSQTYVIAMTDWPRYWEGTRRLGWATDFVTAMRASPVVFGGFIKTTGGNPNNAIFAQGRCHIAFGLTWTGEWLPYGSSTLRYLILRPNSNNLPQWTHPQELDVKEQSEVIPFINSDAREEWRRRHSSERLPPSSDIRRQSGH